MTYLVEYDYLIYLSSGIYISVCSGDFKNLKRYK
jgi:hypothetical protein